MILYKYCGPLGTVNILQSQELKLPYISDVNDPLECLPVFYCGNDPVLLKKQCLDSFKRKRVSLPEDFEEKFQKIYAQGELQQSLVGGLEDHQLKWNQEQGCLLSVSEVSQNMLMWSHYADKHRGAVIGFDFDEIMRDGRGIKMYAVEYSEHRPRVNILIGFDEAVDKAIMTKSIDWSYEREFRTLFHTGTLEELRQKEMASFKDFDGKKTWFLRINPSSIKQVIFGVYSGEALKLSVKAIVQQSEFKHVRICQAVKSETYTLGLEPVI